MNFLNEIILDKGEKVLLPFRSNESILKTFDFADYQKYFWVIKNCYEKAGYWHGTGRYQYAHASDSRYEKIDFLKRLDILELILKEGGLKPHHEPWLKRIQKIFLPTVSMTPYRMYARLYAGLYLYEKDNLLYEFGSTKFWFKFLFTIQILNGKFLYFLFTKGLFKLVNLSSYRNAQIWISSIRNDNGNLFISHNIYISPFKGYLIHTDIPQNYPILLGIKKNIEIIPFNSGMERFEARSTNPVLLKDITHIEVPLNKVRETEDFLKKRNIDLQVIPFEFGEIYCSSFKLKELVGI